MKVVRLSQDSPYREPAITFAERCSWVAGKHFAWMLRENRMTDWESAFAAIDDDAVIGFCTLLKTDYYPENRYSPWISCIFVTESKRGRRVSGQLIAVAEAYALAQGFRRVYIPSEYVGLYEKYGYAEIDTLVNYGGDTDHIFAKQIG